MTAGVLIGPNLASFIASNAALIQPTLVTIQGGTFMMGAGTDYGAHQATISTFQMGQTPVTNDEYARYIASLGDRRHALFATSFAFKEPRVIGVGPSENELRKASRSSVRTMADILVKSGFGSRDKVVKDVLDSMPIVHIRDHKPPKGFDGPRQPVIDVNWFEAAVYASLHGGMLPTEWQWEYAARVVQGREGLREFATSSGQLTHEEAHFDAQSTVDVDDPKYPTLENGLRHMTGNVWEWMRNWHDHYPRGEVVDPIGPLEGSYRVLRGGSWDNDFPDGLHAAYRFVNYPDGSNDFVGFRLVVLP